MNSLTVNFPWTSRAFSHFGFPMSTPLGKLTSPVSLVVDAILVGLFAVIIYSLVKSHVPSNDPFWIMVWGGATTACMSGVFWLAVQMFRVVLKAQLMAKKK